MDDRIDHTKDMYFYDDRSKYDYMYRLERILYNDNEHIICEASCTLLDEGIPNEKFFVKLATGEVLNSDFDSFMATNDIEWAQEEDERIRERANDY